MEVVSAEEPLPPSPTSKEKLDPVFPSSALTLSFFRLLYSLNQSTFIMGVERKIITRGNSTDSPASGDKVSIHYTGWLYDAKKSNKGFQGKQ